MSTRERVTKILIGSVLAGCGYISYLKGLDMLTKGVFNITE